MVEYFKQFLASPIFEQDNAELERFTYTVSHDLKSPLVTIGGFVGFLEKDALAGHLERVKTDVERITEAVERMKRLGVWTV